MEICCTINCNKEVNLSDLCSLKKAYQKAIVINSQPISAYKSLRNKLKNTSKEIELRKKEMRIKLLEN